MYSVHIICHKSRLKREHPYFFSNLDYTIKVDFSYFINFILSVSKLDMFVGIVNTWIVYNRLSLRISAKS